MHAGIKECTQIDTAPNDEGLCSCGGAEEVCCSGNSCSEADMLCQGGTCVRTVNPENGVNLSLSAMFLGF